MNSVARAKLLGRQRNGLFRHLSFTASQQSHYYSMRATRSTKKLEEIPQPKPEKPSVPSSTFSQRIKKKTDELVWPKPREIPFQAKISNFVNLIGNVGIPVTFETSSDGAHFATTVISLGKVGTQNHVSIPVLFEGDLAHVVACHVKKNDCVFVSGQLSIDDLGLSFSGSFGKFHVVAENLNFVEKTDARLVGKKEMVPNMTENLKLVERHENRIVGKKAVNPTWDNAVEFDPQERAKPDEVEVVVKHENLEEVEEKVSKKTEEDVGKKNDFDDTLGLWRDLVKNSLQWYDYRGHKANGLVKEKYPDFKQKVTGNALWLNSAPNWVIHGLGKLEFDVKDMQPRQNSDENGSNLDGWRSLIDNPDKWWDNRENKKTPKSPDFKHKETGEVVWVNAIPAWALSKLPPTKLSQNSWIHKSSSVET